MTDYERGWNAAIEAAAKHVESLFDADLRHTQYAPCEIIARAIRALHPPRPSPEPASLPPPSTVQGESNSAQTIARLRERFDREELSYSELRIVARALLAVAEAAENAFAHAHVYNASMKTLGLALTALDRVKS